jgi:hypothetical protein
VKTKIWVDGEETVRRAWARMRELVFGGVGVGMGVHMMARSMEWEF